MSQASAVRAVLKVLDAEGDPRNMGKREWVDFLEEIITECESRKDAAVEELREADGS